MPPMQKVWKLELDLTRPGLESIAQAEISNTGSGVTHLTLYCHSSLNWNPVDQDVKSKLFSCFAKVCTDTQLLLI